MSLDIAILGPDGSSKKQMSIGVDDHHRLMQIVGARGGLLARLNDYYADAEFEHSELEDLIAEAATVSNHCHDDQRLLSSLRGLAELAEAAKSEGKGLVAIAD